MEEKNYLFSWLDYIVFGSMLGISVIIGIYFALCGNRQNSADEYLKGGKTMKVLPIAVSLIASQIATSTLLAVPSDVYRFGANYLWLGVATLFMCFLGYHIFLPVFFKLQITSVFEYLHLRFNKTVRIVASFFNLLGMFIYCPIVIYIPSLAFAQVTQGNPLVIACISCAICIFYTTIGGFRAVVWTDTLQFIIMALSFFLLFCIGLSAINGFKVLWNTSIEGHRLDIFDFSFDPTLRDSFGAIMIGGTFYWLTITCVDPVCVQKFLSVPTLSDVKKVIVIYAFSVASIHVLSALTGLLMYAKYWNCDPFSAKKIFNSDQLVPYFVMDVAGNIPGYSGVFMAGVFSAGLSTLSASLNTMSAIIYEDFVSLFISKNISQARVTTILKTIVVVTGTIATVLVFALKNINGIFPVYTGIYAATLGPTLGLFFLGVLVPLANSKGALYGSLTGIIFILFVFIQNQRHQSDAYLGQFLKPISTDGCNVSLTNNATKIEVPGDLPFFLYRISFWFNTFMGTMVTVVVGIIISWFTKHDKIPVSETYYLH
ncbi:hypothetical protein RN001_009140 [Aquatica leii]|uniref:Sodium-coupled monocarboxylate transporter 1 n=1 Tax=Aquatica leii TaxID=1421715 RepID=A0AAN7PTG2_9COLE|nr:hypothetical protein RN001_009140 [Aquatica leii]